MPAAGGSWARRSPIDDGDQGCIKWAIFFWKHQHTTLILKSSKFFKVTITERIDRRFRKRTVKQLLTKTLQASKGANMIWNFRTEPELHDSISRFQFVFAFPTHQSLNFNDNHICWGSPVQSGAKRPKLKIQRLVCWERENKLEPGNAVV